jgi:hypothetical protein
MLGSLSFVAGALILPLVKGYRISRLLQILFFYKDVLQCLQQSLGIHRSVFEVHFVTLQTSGFAELTIISGNDASCSVEQTCGKVLLKFLMHLRSSGYGTCLPTGTPQLSFVDLLFCGHSNAPL